MNTKLTPREYASYRSKATGTIVQAQLIYYYIRRGDIVLEDHDCSECGCSRRVLDVKMTDEFFDLKEAKR